MILSERHRFVFVKGKKVAGTSVEVALAGVCGDGDIITPITPVDERQRLLLAGRGPQNYGAAPEALGRFLAAVRENEPARLGELALPKGRYYNHMGLAEIERLYGPLPPAWRIFGVERCPYEKVVSLANMQLRFADYKRSGQPMKSSPEELRREVDALIENGGIASVHNIGQYRDGRGRLRVELLRHERLGTDFEALMRSLGITQWPALPRLKAGLSVSGTDPRTLLTDRQIAAIGERFADEFEAFGYPRLG